MRLKTKPARQGYPLRNQLNVMAIFAAAALVLAALSITVTGMLVSKQKNHAFLFLNDAASQSGEAFESQTDARLATLRAIISCMDDYAPAQREERLLFLKEIGGVAAFTGISYMDADGVADFVNPGGEIIYGVDVRDTDFFKAALAGKEHVAFYRRDDAGVITVFCTVPIYAQGQPAGALCASYDTRPIDSLNNASSEANGRRSFLVDMQGNSFGQPDGAGLPEGGGNLFNLAFKAPYDGARLQESFLAGESGSFAFTGGRGAAYFASYTPLKFGGYYIVSVMEQASASGYFAKTAVLAVSCIIMLCLLCVFALFYNLRTEKRRKETLGQVSSFDSMAGSMNRQRLNVALASIDASDYALAIFDMHNLRIINSQYGYSVGNELISHLTGVLKSNIRKDELCFRDYDGKFGVLLRGADEKPLSARLKKMLEEINSFKMKDDADHRVTCRCGAAMFGRADASLSSDEKLDRAYIALNRAKANPLGNSLAFYNEGFLEMEKRLSFMEANMDAALENGEFVLYLQPKIQLGKGVICGAEVLVRWNTQPYGMLQPGEFIPLFEKNGFITKLDFYTFDKMCAALRKYLDLGQSLPPLSINHSRKLFYLPDYVKTIEQIIGRYDLPPNYITIEITETATIDDKGLFAAIVKSLQEIGIIVSMDDFGTDFSSLNVLQDIPFNELKLDKSFLQPTLNASRQEIIINTAITLAKKMSISTVAEGVETDEQRKFLREIGCDMAQGYYYAKPMPLEEFVQFINGRNGQGLFPPGGDIRA